MLIDRETGWVGICHKKGYLKNGYIHFSGSLKPTTSIIQQISPGSRLCPHNARYVQVPIVWRIVEAVLP